MPEIWPRQLRVLRLRSPLDPARTEAVCRRSQKSSVSLSFCVLCACTVHAGTVTTFGNALRTGNAPVVREMRRLRRWRWKCATRADCADCTELIPCSPPTAPASHGRTRPSNRNSSKPRTPKMESWTDGAHARTDRASQNYQTRIIMEARRMYKHRLSAVFVSIEFVWLSAFCGFIGFSGFPALAGFAGL